MRHNLKDLINTHVNEFALSNQNGTSEIFTELENRGNSSMLQNVVPERGRICTEIQLVDTKEYFEKNFSSFENLILKCDTQGMDALILSNIPEKIWPKIQCAVVEVWALSEINEKDVEKFLSKCQGFEYVSWFPDFRELLDFSEIGEFWLSKTGNWKNLYLSKTN
jgi:hypothetical protein